MVSVEEMTGQEAEAEVRAERLLADGNAAFVDEEYAAALLAYSAALELRADLPEPLVARIHCVRAQAHIRVEDYVNAVDDANRALEIDASLHRAHLRKGIACFWLEEYETAKASFQKGMVLADSPGVFQTWIRKCDAEMDVEEEDASPPASASLKAAPPAPPANPSTSTPVPPAVPLPATATDDSMDHEPASMESAEPPAPAPNSKYRHQWYQSPSKVTLSIMAKGIKQERAVVRVEPDFLSVHIKDPSLQDMEYVLDLHLCGSIDPSSAKVEFLSTKIEISLPKADGLGHWPALERSAANSVVAATPSSGPPQYPSSHAAARKKPTDWDKIETEVIKEEKDEKLEGDAALQKLFRDIYGNADEDTRRAMNKSFMESNGTVLSTNWKEIGSKKVECTPPSGMEVKKYES